MRLPRALRGLGYGVQMEDGRPVCRTQKKDAWVGGWGGSRGEGQESMADTRAQVVLPFLMSPASPPLLPCPHSPRSTCGVVWCGVGVV